MHQALARAAAVVPMPMLLATRAGDGDSVALGDAVRSRVSNVPSGIADTLPVEGRMHTVFGH